MNDLTKYCAESLECFAKNHTEYCPKPGSLSEYERGRAEGIQEGRRLERDDAVAWLRTETAPYMQDLTESAIEKGLAQLPATAAVHLCGERDKVIADAIMAGEHTKEAT